MALFTSIAAIYVSAFGAGALAAGLTFVTVAVISTAASTLISLAISKIFGPGKPKMPNLAGFEARATGATQTIRNPVLTQRLLSGEFTVGGVIVHAHSADGDPDFHVVVVFCANEVEAIDTVWLADRPVYSDQIDASGNVTSGVYAGKLRIFKFLGADDQQPPPELVGVGGWTSEHRLRGHAGIYCRLERDRDAFPLGLPNIRATIRGKKVFDPRDAGTRYSNNPALVIRDWMSAALARGGLGTAETRLPDTVWNAAANVCDEFVDTKAIAHTVGSVSPAANQLTISGDFTLVTGDRCQVSTTGTLPGGLAAATDYYVIVDKGRDPGSASGTGGVVRLAASYAEALARTAIDITGAGSGAHTLTKTGEPRYTCDGIIELDRRPREILQDLLSSLAGTAPYIGGTWHLQPGAWVAPTITLDEGDVDGEIAVQTRVGRRERANAVKGVFVSPLNDWEPSDYTAVTNATYEAADQGERKFKELDLPLTSRGHMAQRLAKIELERGRREIRISPLPCKLAALTLRAGDTFSLDNTRFEWTAKSFLARELKLAQRSGGEDDAPRWGIDITAQEIDEGVFEWSSIEEATLPPRRDAGLDDPFSIQAPTDIRLTTQTVEIATGVDESRIVLEWTPPASRFVTNGGTIEIQYRRSLPGANFLPSFEVPGNETRKELPTIVKIGEEWDIRLRSRNSLGSHARDEDDGWVTITGYEVGTVFGGRSGADWGGLGAAISSADWGDLGPALSSNDWGSLS